MVLHLPFFFVNPKMLLFRNYPAMNFLYYAKYLWILTEKNLILLWQILLPIAKIELVTTNISSLTFPIIPLSLMKFPGIFHLSFPRCHWQTCRHHLCLMLKTLFSPLIFLLPTTFLLMVFLKYSGQLRDFCGFDFVLEADCPLNGNDIPCGLKDQSLPTKQKVRKFYQFCKRTFYLYPGKNLCAYPDWIYTIKVDTIPHVHHCPN